MSENHFIAILTYGTEKQRGLSSFKLGYGAGMAVLLALFGSHATETSPSQASYRYLHIDAKKRVTTHRYFIVLSLTPAEKARVEAICRAHGSTTYVYLWEDNRWLDFPCSPQAHYSDPTSYGSRGPKFLPTHASFVTPSRELNQTSDTPAKGTVTITQSGDWWWIAGETYPHRDMLKNCGAKWSKTRQAWYYKGTGLPQVIRDLAEKTRTAPAAPAHDAIPDLPQAETTIPDPSPVPKMTETRETMTHHGLTLTPSDDGWWIAGDTVAHRHTLSAAGAHWSLAKGQWYIKGRDLPPEIRNLVTNSQPVPAPVTSEKPPSPPPVEELVTGDGTRFTVTKREIPLRTFAASDRPSVDEVATEPLDLLQDVPEALMRSVRTDDVTAALVAHIHDGERSRPVMVDFIGSRNAIKQLLSKPFNPAYIGPRAEGAAFILINGSHHTSFRLPDTFYKTMSATLGGRVVEGRIIALDATVSAARESCYVLVMNRIELPPLSESVEDAWQYYLHYRQTPNRSEFSHYVPPGWAADLYNVYQALRTRIGRPLHERWMPWLFTRVADQPLSSARLNLRQVTLCKYISGYVDPKARGVVESGAYRLTCRDMADLWAEVIVQNPKRADGITFSQPS